MDDARAREAIIGCLLGTACGDSLGLPHEGLPPSAVARALADRPLAQRWLLGRGMVSDDTEQSAALAEALCETRTPDALARAFARRLRAWFLALPPGLGLGTARACLRLCVGIPATRAGVRSAGNGAAMRAAILGAAARDEAHADAMATACARVTHTDERAIDGARVVARLAYRLAREELERALLGRAPTRALISETVRDDETRQACLLACALAEEGASLETYRERLACPRGPTGFIAQTLPAALFCVTRHRDEPRAAVEAAVRLGGDTDTIAAIVGGLLGAAHGAAAWPPAWVERVVDWPWNARSLARLGAQVAAGPRGRAAPRLVPLARWPFALARNLVMLLLAILHVIARARFR